MNSGTKARVKSYFDNCRDINTFAGIVSNCIFRKINSNEKNIFKQEVDYKWFAHRVPITCL